MIHLFTQRLFLFFIICLCLILSGSSGMASDQYAELRQRMVKAIEADVYETSLYINKKKLDARVMSVMGWVERHKFVPPSHQSRAVHFDFAAATFPKHAQTR